MIAHSQVPYLMLLTFGTIFRDGLRFDLQKQSKHRTTSEKTSIEDRRRKLEGRLNRFNQKAEEFIGDGAEEDLDVLPQFTGWEESNEGFDGNEEEAWDSEDEDEDENSEKPETTRICMPSSLNSQDIQRLDLKVLAAQELELRKGQANDCLQGLRLALGHKSILYRNKARSSKSSVDKTRVKGDIKATAIKVDKHVRAYRRARKALEHLGANDFTLAKFQKLQTADLKLSADITEENRVGQRSDTLPWFWRLDVKNADQNDAWMQECGFLFILHMSIHLNCHLVYRVNWLRAKARYDRWKEELEIVKHEMKWTILWFEHQLKEWMDRLNGSIKEDKPGHIAYAEKQVAMWKTFIKEGERSFRGKMAN